MSKKIDTKHWICDSCKRDFDTNQIFSTTCPVCGGLLRHDIREVKEE